jgi:hypothetical protein
MQDKGNNSVLCPCQKLIIALMQGKLNIFCVSVGLSQGNFFFEDELSLCKNIIPIVFCGDIIFSIGTWIYLHHQEFFLYNNIIQLTIDFSLGPS